ncbi:MAG: hypothetical protein NTY53_11710 [Kiritimatiellaeota bacterium]|nr:hypothetical protein [Kiritimatiellota bacterium]
METQLYSVLSVMGPHAGEDSDKIFARKIADIRIAGKTFWVIRSYKAKPDMIQTICLAARDRANEPLCAFLEPSSPGGAVPTKTSCAAAEYSTDLSKWESLPSGIGPVTGKMTRGACALVFDQLVLCESRVLDLWDCADFFNQEQPVKIRQGASTIGVVGKNTSAHSDRMKSHIRQVLAIGRLTEPFAVWLR